MFLMVHDFNFRPFTVKKIWIFGQKQFIFAEQMRKTIVHKAPGSLFSQCDYRGIETLNPFLTGRFVTIFKHLR